MSHPNRSPLSDAAAPDINQTRAIIADLCDLWDEGVRDEHVVYRGELDSARAVAIRTQAHHAVRLARAILQLDETMSGIETIPLSRFIFECAVTASWLLVTPGSGHALIRDGARRRLKAFESAAMPDGPDSEGYAQAVETIRHLEEAEGPRAFVFEQRCRELEGGDRLYLLYRVMSAESHAGLGIADFYSLADNGSEIGVSFNPDAASSIRPAMLGTTACLLLMAVNADELARDKPHRTTQIAKAADQLGVGTRIVRKDGFEQPERNT